MTSMSLGRAVHGIAGGFPLPCMANASVGPKSGTASYPQILSLDVVPLKRGSSRHTWSPAGTIPDAELSAHTQCADEKD